MQPRREAELNTVSACLDHYIDIAYMTMLQIFKWTTFLLCAMGYRHVHS